MKLLELLPHCQIYGRITKSAWSNRYLVRSVFDSHPLVLCDFHSMIIESYALTFLDLSSDDWELLE